MPPLDDEEEDLFSVDDPDVVDLSDPDEKDDDADDGGDGKGRRERRRDRGELFNSLREKDDELARRDKELSELRERMARMEGYNSATQRPQETPLSKIEKHLDGIYEREMQLQEEIAALGNSKQGITDEKRKELWERGRKLETEKTEAQVVRANIKYNVRPYEPPKDNTAQAIVATRYPDLQANQNAGRYALATHQQLVAKGEPDTLETFDKAARQARREFKLTQKPEPTDRDRGRYSDVGGRSGETRRQPAGGRVRITEHEKGLAEALYSDLNISAAEKHRRWLKNVKFKGS